MRNNPFFFWLLMFADGVFAADVVKSVSVMVGDSVTLHTDDAETQGALELNWRIQGENKFIAEVDKEMSTTKVPGNEEEQFRGRLKLDGQTGSLTITNLKTTDSRVYELEIKYSKETKFNIFNVAVSDEVRSVSVMEGDSVTLHTDVANIQRDDQIIWKFGDQGTIIARLNSPSTWGNVHLNDQTGQLTVKNIQKDQHGYYEVKINTSSVILQKKFCITVDELKSVAVKVGDFVILRTGLTEIQGYDLTWKSQDHLMAEINRAAHRSSLYGSANGISEDRLQLHPQSGSLIISDIKTTDSGDYYLNMSSSSSTIQRTFSVTVRGAASGISGAGVGLVVWAVIAVLLQDL